jgi:hypothetical protein
VIRSKITSIVENIIKKLAKWHINFR